MDESGQNTATKKLGVAFLRFFAFYLLNVNERSFTQRKSIVKRRCDLQSLERINLMRNIRNVNVRNARHAQSTAVTPARVEASISTSERAARILNVRSARTLNVRCARTIDRRNAGAGGGQELNVRSARTIDALSTSARHAQSTAVTPVLVEVRNSTSERAARILNVRSTRTIGRCNAGAGGG
jgi:hypothetical protein